MYRIISVLWYILSGYMVAEFSDVESRSGNGCNIEKGNFCKTFKQITGDTFHQFLNKYRVKMACVLLELTDYSVETIASEVGFADAKSLCRVFKSIKKMTTGQYRKEKREK